VLILAIVFDLFYLLASLRISSSSSGEYCGRFLLASQSVSQFASHPFGTKTRITSTKATTTSLVIQQQDENRVDYNTEEQQPRNVVLIGGIHW